MTNRVHIDAPAGVIDLEGEKDFVEGMLAKLFPLIEEAGFGSRPHADLGISELNEQQNASNEDQSQQEAGKLKSRKRKVSNPPKGQSCPDRMMSLKSDGFFRDPKVASEIVAGLAAKGWKHTTNQVSAATESLFKRSLIQRTKEGGGPWKYYWDRD